MVRLSLGMCRPELKSPADIYLDKEKKRLLVKKGTPLTDRIKELIARNKIEYLEFPFPFEKKNPPPYTFSEEIEYALFFLIRDSYLAFQEDSVTNPRRIRKDVYEILTEAANEFKKIIRCEDPMDDSPPKRLRRSIVHLRTIGALEDYLFEHGKNVGLICAILAFDYYKESPELLAHAQKIATAGFFADIGMMKIPAPIREKKGKLTEEEWKIVQNHPETSAHFVASMFQQENFVTTRVVRQHHERNDGSGYPSKIGMDKIEPYAQILAVADSYHSMISKRYFRTARNPVDALCELNQQARQFYDSKAVLCLNYRIAPYPIGSVAHFTGGRLIQILSLTNTPAALQHTVIHPGLSREQVYNMPSTIRAFHPDKPLDAFKSVSVIGHWDKIGIPLDTYDLLGLYGYIEGTPG